MSPLKAEPDEGRELRTGKLRDFPGGPVVKTPHFQCKDAAGEGSIPGRGAKIPHAVDAVQKKKKRECGRPDTF